MTFTSLCRATLFFVPITIAAQDQKPELAPIAEKRPKAAFVGTPKTIPEGMNVRRPTGIPRGEFLAPRGTANLALGKPVTSSDREPVIGSLGQVTDGDKAANDGSYVELAPDLQWVQIDLQQPATIYAIIVWHNHTDPRVYRDVVVNVSDDPEFKSGVKTVFNNDADNSAKLGKGADQEEFEVSEGHLIEAKGAAARYVRLYSRGNTNDDQNHYTEVEVYGLPIKK